MWGAPLSASTARHASHAAGQRHVLLGAGGFGEPGGGPNRRCRLRLPLRRRSRRRLERMSAILEFCARGPSAVRSTCHHARPPDDVWFGLGGRGWGTV